MNIVNKLLSDICPYKNNPRKNDPAVNAVAESIRQCGYIAPIIVDEDNVILAGHTRWEALKKLGRTECECVVKAGLTEEQKKKYRLLDNKTNELADWDFDMLADELEGLDFGDLQLDWGVGESIIHPEIVKKELKPYKKVHYLVTVDINKNDEIIGLIQSAKEIEGVEIESSLN